ncbi:MAG: hypothetical protein ABI861_03260 [Panacibacter sp.]
MNLKTFRSGIALLILAAGISATSCKGKATENNNTSPAVDTTVTIDNTPVPPEIATDDSLRIGVNDAIKDFPGVTAKVENGEVTLDGGPVSRDQLQILIQSVQSLHPKKVNNNLSVK